jgi:PAS domain S-box-containing protein
MKDESKTKAQLITELRDLRQKLTESEARQIEHVSAQKALLESAAAAIVIIDETGHIVLVNSGAETMFGYTRQEMIGQLLEMLLPRRSAETHVFERNSFFAHPRVRSMGIGLDLVGRHKDGHEFPIEVGLSYAHTDDGMLAMSFIIDVTERRRGEIQRRLMERAIDAATNGIVITDAQKPDMPIIYVNPAFERITGYSRAEVVGRNCRFLQAGDHDQPALQDLRTALREGRSCQVVLRNYRKDGSLFWNELSLAPVHDEEDRLVHYVGVQNDITERKHTDEQLARKNEALDAALVDAEEATRAKSEFLANMSHEIRTPLNAIIGMSGLLLDTSLTVEQRDYAETIRTSSDSLLAIVNDILDFSKIEASRLELEQQPFDLRVCIEESLDLLAPAAAQKDLELGYLIDDNVPLTLIGDVTRVRQILVNLLSNAVKFTDHGEVIISVGAKEMRLEIGDSRLEIADSKPEATRAGDEHQSSIVNPKSQISNLQSPLFELTFAVRDTGIGIPEDRRERLFQPFSQLDASTTRRYGGTGLGLAISMRLCELMGGRIWVESSGVPEQGSTFYFTIKAEAADMEDLSGPASIPTELSGKRALIVDDNATNRLILMRQIEPWGMSGREAASGREALQWVQQGETFDIAILDVRMPEMDGLTLARELYQVRPAMPLVILTSMGRREPELSDLKVSAFLTKPIKPAQLYRVLTAALQGQSLPPGTVVPRERGAASIDTQMGIRHPLRILLAEDNIVNQKVAVRILERLGYRPDVAANGLEVLQALQRQTYDVVLMDVQMPEMDGLETTRRIVQRWPKERRPRLIAMTAYALEGDRERCLEAGMDDYISKPIRMDELVRSLEQSAPSRKPAQPEQPKPSAPPCEAADRQHAVDQTVLDNLRTVLHDEAGEVVTIFLENGAHLLAEMQLALSREDASALEHAAHTLKSSSATFGALSLSAICKELEVMGRQKQLAGAEEKVRCAGDEFERVKVEIREIVK